MKRIVIISIIAVFFVGCGGGSSSNLDKSISQVEKALEKVEKNKGQMTVDDWNNLEKELEEPLKVISDALDSDKVGVMAKMKIVAVAAKWAAVLAEAGAKEIEKQTGITRENWGNELEKVVKELEKATDELEKATNELVEN